jgi:hypothetical protein
MAPDPVFQTNGKGFPVTACPMTEREKRRFNRWKRR